MSKTTTKPKRTTRPSTRAANPKPDPLAAALAERRALQRARTTQRQIVTLGNQLAREIRKADYQLADLGARLLDRARRSQQAEAGQDFIRETSVADRQPQAVE